MESDLAPDGGRGVGGESLPLPPYMERLRPVITGQTHPVYLVGGVVRDALLGRTGLHDLDFVVPEEAIELAFWIANKLRSAAYILDQDRDIARIVVREERLTLDFAGYRGHDLESDLRDRDFTINAMALPISAARSASIIDPCDGLADLSAGLIRQTHERALIDDPVRTIRALRLALSLGFTLTADTAEAVFASASGLSTISSERIRDELLKLLSLPVPHRAVSLLSQFGLLDVILPEIAALRDVNQSPPHREPVLEHTESVLRWLALIEAVVCQKSKSVDPLMEMIHAATFSYSEQLSSHFDREFDGNVDGRLLLRLGAMFHDVGKPGSQTVNEEGRIRFLGHEQIGRVIVGERLRQLSLSSKAIHHVKRIVANHMRPLLLANDKSMSINTPRVISRRAIYRFYRDTGQAGIDVCLLSLADHLGTHDGPGDVTQWERLLQIVSELLHNYFEHQEDTIAPTPLLSGRDLIDGLKIKPGPEIGRLLRLIEESQAAGEITNREEAMLLARRSQDERASF